jgi:hypothetical protein
MHRGPIWIKLMCASNGKNDFYETRHEHHGAVDRYSCVISDFLLYYDYGNRAYL